MNDRERLLIDFTEEIDKEFVSLMENYRNSGKIIYGAIVDVCRNIVKKKLDEKVKGVEWEWLKIETKK